MPSRKRNKGKERKAKKAEVEAENRIAFVRQKWQGWARGEDNNKKVVHCEHGLNVMIPDNSHPVSKFLDTFFIVGDLENVLQLHPQLCKTESYRKMAANLLVSMATTILLHPIDGDMAIIANLTCAIVMLENSDETDDFHSVVCKQAVATKIRDLNHLIHGDVGRDSLKFYRKRISCSCLKDMHLHARKTLPKLGMCSHCGELKERATLMVCGRCKIDQYCSSECQVAAWPQHKSGCRDHDYVDSI